MQVRYYKQDILSYANRRRYSRSVISTLEFSAEEKQYRSIVFGDGAKTQIKTSSKNICNYVTIDNTGWYVTSYTYLNGGQVVLNLQRDVIGENSLNGLFGKIERGYTETFLRNKRELSLNQRLINRIPLKQPITEKRGNCEIQSLNENTSKELWGILYFVKPSSETGETKNINIPAFAPQTTDYPYIPNGTHSSVISTTNQNVEIDVYVIVNYDNGKRLVRYFCQLYFEYVAGIWKKLNYTNIVEEQYSPIDNGIQINVSTSNTAVYKEIVSKYLDIYCSVIASNNSGFTFPLFNEYTTTNKNYDGITIKYNEKFLKYTATTGQFSSYGSVDNDKIKATLNNQAGSKTITINNNNYVITDIIRGKGFSFSFNSVDYKADVFSYVELTGEEAGNIAIPLSQQLVDEPYSILVCPLFDGTIKIGTKVFNVSKTKAFSVFNYVIEGLSGENSYLVDAQIYPYCPNIANTSCEFKEIPFCTISSNTYVKSIKITPSALTDIKKDYIERSYSIVSPEQSGKFTFNFYDYTNDNSENSYINIDIKTSLKPFSIISSAVLRPNAGALIGETYDSDLRGCMPSSNGFECSLASNAFETYRRQNSNYQQIFALQQGELQKSHEVERVNERVQGLANTITQAAMGAIGGASLGGKIGAAVGGVAATAAVGVANLMQFNANEELRAYEETLQKQNFDLQIGTVKNLPNTINRISSFNEIVLKDFYYTVEVYECSDREKIIVDTFIEKYGYELGVIDYFYNFYKEKGFIRGSLMQSNLIPVLHNIAAKELAGGIYYYEQI